MRWLVVWAGVASVGGVDRRRLTTERGGRRRAAGCPRACGTRTPGRWAWLALRPRSWSSRRRASSRSATPRCGCKPIATSGASCGSCSPRTSSRTPGLTDVALAYGIGVFPLGWLLSGIGSVLVVRALVVEDLLRVRAIDTTAPRARPALRGRRCCSAGSCSSCSATACRGGSRRSCSRSASSACARRSRSSASSIAARAATRARSSGCSASSSRARARSSRSPRSRSSRSTSSSSASACASTILLAAAEDYGWTHRDRRRKLADDAAPDPLLGGWLAEQRAPLFADELDARPRRICASSLAALFDDNDARALVPVASADELLALVLVPRPRGACAAASSRSSSARASGSAKRSSTRAWRSAPPSAPRSRARSSSPRRCRRSCCRRRARTSTATSPSSARGARRRAAPVTSGASIRSAMRARARRDRRCHRPRRRVGDGHRGGGRRVRRRACAASGARSSSRELITALDAAVRRVGGGQLAMTCFAAILDPDAGEIRFVSCGHTTPVPRVVPSERGRAAGARRTRKPARWPARRRSESPAANRCEPAISSSGIPMV